MSVLSGKDGTLKWNDVEEQHVRNWRLTQLSDNQAYHDNTCGGWRKRVPGVKDSNGTFEMTDKPSHGEGSTGTIALYTNQDIYTVDVVIDSVDTNTDFEGAIVGYTVTFSGTGSVAETTGSAP